MLQEFEKDHLSASLPMKQVKKFKISVTSSELQQDVREDAAGLTLLL